MVKVRLPRLLAHRHLRHPFIGVSTRGRHVETGHQLVTLIPRAKRRRVVRVQGFFSAGPQGTNMLVHFRYFSREKTGNLQLL